MSQKLASQIRFIREASLTTHTLNWCGCTKCPLSKTRTNVVLFRYLNKYHEAAAETAKKSPNASMIPCDVLFVGEGPGESEDITGEPFTGPSGRILTTMINNAVSLANEHHKRLITHLKLIGLSNIVACQPLDQNKRNIPPTKAQAEACSPRLMQLIKSAEPRLVIAVGKTAASLFPGKLQHAGEYFPSIEATAEIIHPAAILRMLPAKQATEIRKCELNIASALKGII